MTAQVGETLIINGMRLHMAFCPPLPPDHALLVHTEISHSQRKDENGVMHYEAWEKWLDRDGNEHIEQGSSFIESTACWRRYIGTWKIKDQQFWLVGLQGRLRLAVQGPILADWFTGILRIPQGGRLQYVHMGFGSVYETELHIKIERGKVLGRRVLDNRGQEHDPQRLGWENLPGRENRFKGDRDFN